MTFRCDFGKGVSCEMVIADEPPLKGAPTSTALNTFTGPFLSRFILRIRRPSSFFRYDLSHVLINTIE